MFVPFIPSYNDFCCKALNAPLPQALSSQALTSLIQSNHTNQGKAAEEGGIEMLSDLLESLVIPQHKQQAFSAILLDDLQPHQQDTQEDEDVCGSSNRTRSSYRAELLESLLRLLGAMAEFNENNQQAAR